MKAKQFYLAGAGRWRARRYGAGVLLLLPLLVAAQSRDFGDAPAPYPTLLNNNGAWHVVSGPRLGTLIDSESDGQPNPAATGDDLAGIDDEDGVTFLTLLVPGQMATIQVVVSGTSATARLEAWVDFGVDGSWAEAGDRIFQSLGLTAGTHILSFPVPASAKLGSTFARFRISATGDLNFTGGRNDGEVEDYRVGISDGMDFGDAPTNSYPTLLIQNGARHLASRDFCLGTEVDVEANGQPDSNAKGDDANPPGAASDEDGVVFTGALVPGELATVEVFCTIPVRDAGRLNAWVDFNQDGTWDASEQILTDEIVTGGLKNFVFDVPESAVGGITFARFRLNRDGKLGPAGAAQDGEVEDYRVDVQQSLDFGDAPGKYPTLLANNGARHVADSRFCLGQWIDTEPDGQPEANALGDDQNPPGVPDDEDGITFISAIEPGKIATLQVFLTAPGATTPGMGRLDAWVDFNGNESWGDVGEQIFTNYLIFAGTTTLTFAVPATAAQGPTFARFRLSQQGGLGPGGAASNGEVEDYRVHIQQLLDFGDAPSPYPTLLTDNGARHAFVRDYNLGLRVDVEPDGQPSPASDGDDLNPSQADDEDGVVFSGVVVPGRVAAVQVTASRSGRLYAWVDFNRNGSWADAGEKVFGGLVLASGVNNLTFPVPADAQTGRTYSRWRFTVQGPDLDFIGAAPDGEVEDHLVSIIPDRERCDLGCEGLEFWLTFPGNYAPDRDNPTKPSLCIQGPLNTVGVVSIPALGFTTNFVIPATFTVRVPLPRAADLGDLNDAVTNAGIHVVASADVRITAFNHARYTTDSYQALNTSVIGTEYVVLGFGNVHTGVPPLNGSQFALVATASNTVVTITPSVSAGARSAGVPYNLLLQPGDAYQLRATNDAPADLTGTIIKSSKPIAVFGSHQCANVPSSAVWFCDYLVEQLLPVNTWGNEFYTAPLATRTGGDTFRFLAAYDATAVAVNGVVVTNLNRGQAYQRILTSRSRILTSRPVLAAQYANSADYDGNSKSDPFMVQLQATRHFSTGYIICTPTNDFPTNYVQIIAPTSAVASVQIDGVAVGAGAFQNIPGSFYAAANVIVSPGSHFVLGGAPFGISVYGWAEYDSYGHPGCYYFGDVVPPRVTPETPSITVSVASYPNTPGQAPVPNVSSAAQADDNCSPQLTRPTQTPAAGVLLNPGIHTLTLTVPDDTGNLGEANVTFTVLDPSPVVITCPSNLTVNCASPAGAVVNFTVAARTTYDPNVPVVSTPPSGSLFPPGTTVVTNVATSLAGQSNACLFSVTVICDARVTASLGRNGLNLTWPGTATLEHSSNVLGPWQPIATGVNSYTAPTTGARGFYRVRY